MSLFFSGLFGFRYKVGIFFISNVLFFFLVSLEDFFLSLIFRSLILMYLGMDFFVSVLFEVFLAS